MSHGLHRSTRSNDRRGQQPPRFELLQVVYVRDAHPDLGLVKGESGTIVEGLERPYPAYLIEFIEDDGSTKARSGVHPRSAEGHTATSIGPLVARVPAR